jgi:hypothetical protein
MGLILGGPFVAAAAPPAGFISFRSVGTRISGPPDGVGPHALPKPPGYQAGDLLVVGMNATGTSGTWPTEVGTWTVNGNGSNRICFRVATGDASDDFTTPAFVGNSVTSLQMAAFDITGYSSAVQVAGASLLTNDSFYGTGFPNPGWSNNTNTQLLNISIFFKKTNVRLSPSDLNIDDYLSAIAAATNTQASGDLGTYWFDGLDNNPSTGLACSWGGWTYHITELNPAGPITFDGHPFIEAPESSGFEVVSHYGARIRITV